jgi:[protein-PII] uridylyltransferase
LFHDIAKGRGGDHSVLGGEDAWDFCKLHHLSDYDAGLVRWLVENHLVMSLTAQREDIEDPVVIERFAARIGDVQRLDHLFLITVADARATNPQRWNSWKQSLLNRLYRETRHALARGFGEPLQLNQLAQEKQSEAKRLLLKQGFTQQELIALWMSLDFDYFVQQSPEEIAWHSALLLQHDDLNKPLVALRHAGQRGADELFVCMRDRDGLFAQITALLHQLGLNIHAARVQTSHTGILITSFFVMEQGGGCVTEGWREHHLVSDIEQALTDPAGVRSIKPGGLSRRARAFNQDSQITFRGDPDRPRNIMQIETMDRPGLLSMIGQVFCEQGIRLHNARITTFGAVAEDSFVLSNRQTGQQLSGDRINRLSDALKQLLDG